MNEPERDDVQLEEEGNEANTQLLELQDALINAMTASGLLGKIRAELRGAALGMLRGDEPLQKASVGEPFNLMRATPPTRLALLIIQEFLHSKGLLHSSGVLEAEASTNLHSDVDVRVLQERFVPLPGEGSILERLISTVLEGGNSAQVSAPPPQASEEAGDRAAAVQETREATQLDNEPNAPPESIDVTPAIREALDRYEDSLTFELVDGPIDASAYDAVESL